MFEVENQSSVPGDGRRSSHQNIVSSEPNPYEPPPAKPLVSLLWDRSILTQIGYCIQLLVLIAYTFITVDSDRSATSILAEIDVRFHIAAAACSAVGFAMIFAMTITKSAWSLHQRLFLIGTDLLLLGFLAYVSQGFGTLCR